jgi:hypothetical protein
MRDYRVIELRPDGHVTTKFDFSARDDEAAKEQALKAASSRDLEGELAQSQAGISERLRQSDVHSKKTARGGGAFRQAQRHECSLLR